jgi:hypothetical protein
MSNPAINGDVRVVGLVTGTHLIEDIGRDVPYGVMVTIPADLALRSKDLWRGVEAKCLHRIPAVLATAVDQEKIRLRQYITELESHLAQLTQENVALKAQLEKSSAIVPPSYDAKLDSILAAIQNVAVVAPGSVGTTVTTKAPTEIVDGSAPTFLPSEIKPKDVNARIDVQGEKSESSGLSEAAERLRKLRKKS